MPMYRYTVKDATGQTKYGVLSARNETEARQALAARGYDVLTLEVPSSAMATQPPRPRYRASAEAKALFFRQLASLVRAGLSPYAALEDLSRRLTSPVLRHVAGELKVAVQSGEPLSEAMKAYRGLFPSHVVATVHAGETGGFLDIALDEIGLEYEQEHAFYRGMWLPRALILQQLFALALAQPLFPTLFPNNQLGLYLVLALLRNVPIVIGFLVLARWLWSRFQTPEMAERKSRWLLRAPVFGDLARQRSLAAFIRMLRRLYAAGLMPLNAWEFAVPVVPHSDIRERLTEAQTLLDRGVPLHEAFRATGLFASEAEQLLATGVVSGEVVEMLDRVAEYYQQNVEQSLSQARFWMYRLAFTLFLILTGTMLIYLVRSYFDAVFRFTEGWA